MKPPAADAPPGPRSWSSWAPPVTRLRQLDLLPRPFRIICSGPERTGQRVHVHRGRCAAASRCAAARSTGRPGRSSSSGSVSCPPPTTAPSWAQAVSAAVAELGGAPCVFYLAVPPSATESVVRMLGTFDLERAGHGRAGEAVRHRPGLRPSGFNAVLHKVFVAELARDWFVLRLGGSRQSSVRH